MLWIKRISSIHLWSALVFVCGRLFFHRMLVPWFIFSTSHGQKTVRAVPFYVTSARERKEDLCVGNEMFLSECVNVLLHWNATPPGMGFVTGYLRVHPSCCRFSKNHCRHSHLVAISPFFLWHSFHSFHRSQYGMFSDVPSFIQDIGGWDDL